MITRHRRGAVVALLALSVGALTVGCRPAVLNPSGGGSTTCPQGSWTLSAESITTPLATFLGDATITTSGSGIKLDVSGSGAWTLTADQSAHVVVASPAVDLSATVNGTAKGTYTVSGSTVTFTVATIAGTVQYSGTVMGRSISGSVSLPSLGSATKLWALQGSATYACNGDGTLGLTFPSFGMHLHR